MGTLRVRLRNTITRDETVPLWEASGDQGDLWLRGHVPINTTWTVSQVVRNDVKLGRNLTFSHKLTNNLPHPWLGYI